MADVTLANGGVDEERWAWIPDVSLDDDAGRAWVDDAVAVLRPAARDDVSDDALRDLAASILAYRAPFEGAAARFWHVPRERATLAVATAYVVPDPDPSRPVAINCLEGFDEGLLQRDVAIDHPLCTEAAETVAVAYVVGGGELTVARRIGRVQGALLIVEVLDPDPVRIAVIAQDLTELFLALEPRRQSADETSPGARPVEPERS